MAFITRPDGIVKVLIKTSKASKHVHQLTGILYRCFVFKRFVIGRVTVVKLQLLHLYDVSFDHGREDVCNTLTLDLALK